MPVLRGPVLRPVEESHRLPEMRRRASFAAAILPSKGDYPGAAAPAPPKPREVEVEEAETADVELVSLEDVEEPGKADDETAGIEDVDLGEEAEPAEAEEDDTFLVVEEEEGDNVSGLLDSGPPGGKEARKRSRRAAFRLIVGGLRN